MQRLGRVCKLDEAVARVLMNLIIQQIKNRTQKKRNEVI